MRCALRTKSESRYLSSALCIGEDFATVVSDHDVVSESSPIVSCCAAEDQVSAMAVADVVLSVNVPQCSLRCAPWLARDIDPSRGRKEGWRHVCGEKA